MSELIRVLGSPQDREDRLMTLFAQLSASVIERGCAFAKRDDANAYRVASKFLTKPGARMELRVVIDQAGRLRARGVVADDGGEALVQVFEIAALGDETEH